MVRILGIDPGLHITGWGVIDYDMTRLQYVSHGTITSSSSEKIGDRLGQIFKKLTDVIEEFSPNEVSIEQVFVNTNGLSSLKLGMARGSAICAANVLGLSVYEYTPNDVKKTIVGVGHASKDQISMMIRKLLNCGSVKSDAADALAIAICRAHHRNTYKIAQCF